MSRARLAGLLLAGGGATRFGSDKALVEVEGQTLLDRAVECLRTVCDGPVLVASGDGRSRPDVADGQVADVVADGGPLAGIAAGLAALAGEAGAVAVLAVDHVRPSPLLLRLLEDQRRGAACAMVEVGGRRQPLQAVWATAVAEELSADVRDGRRGVLAWLDGRDDVVVLPEVVLHVAGIPPEVAADVDTPDDLPT